MAASPPALANLYNCHPPAGWVTLAEVSDFVLSFPWVWNWKRAPRLPPHQPPARLSLFMARRMNELQSPSSEDGCLQYKVVAPLPPWRILSAPHCKVLSRLSSFRARQALKGASVSSGGAIEIIRVVSLICHIC